MSYLDYRGFRFELSQESLGPLYRVSARVPATGPFVRVRPFTALGTSREQALQLLEEQLRLEFRKVPVRLAEEATLRVTD